MSKPSAADRRTCVTNLFKVKGVEFFGRCVDCIVLNLVIAGIIRSQQVSSTRVRKLIVIFLTYRDVVNLKIFPSELTTTLTSRGITFPEAELTVDRKVTRYLDCVLPFAVDVLFACD